GQGVGWEGVRGLGAMLEGGEEEVARGELARLLPGEVPALGQAMERPQALPLLEPGILGAVEELEGLDVELDVADPAHAELHVALVAPPRAQGPVDAGLHRLDVA